MPLQDGWYTVAAMKYELGYDANLDGVSSPMICPAIAIYAAMPTEEYDPKDRGLLQPQPNKAGTDSCQLYCFCVL